MNTIAFFGATGGCTNACLAYTLLNGYNARALARTPSKLTALLLTQPGITQKIISNQLEVIEGDATDVESVKKTLIISTDSNNTCTPVSSIISGVGGTGIMSFTRETSCQNSKFRVPALPHIELDNPHITEQTTRALLAALEQIAARFSSFEEYRAVAPRVTVISTTGNLPGSKDVGFWFRPMYNVLLPIPHADKLQMEKLLDKEAELGGDGVLAGGLVVVRPSFLMGDHLIPAREGEKEGQRVGLKGVRVGTERDPAVGYTIPRALVGKWIFEEVIRHGGAQWVGEKVTITA
ncbi:uncharacterized protein N7529_011058 [Penicillium soppii]|jgi:hypothetical protein|uniref:uncharacterized protein n=1 Tax=Penicillium soppii TaxID=69789 RepID=UPI002546B45C|nr:uncharacterized protein N7529_011058 [Penicillium soppii]KAJ5851673.1 hypothetical protein N7529_011058 [Penicillium soppii]